MKKNKTKIIKYRFLLLFAGILLSFGSHAQNIFTVTEVTDHPSGGGTPGQLRWAINQALATPGEALINFNIAGTPPFIIELHATLPLIEKTIIIDGTTQPGYDPADPASPVVILDGYDNGNGPLTNGLYFYNSERCKVIGLGLRKFWYGLMLFYANNMEIRNNVINTCDYYCIYLGNSNFNVMKGNYLNTDKNLSSLPLRSTKGISFTSSNDNTVGGINCGEGNVIGYVKNEGIDNIDPTGQRNKYSGNRIFESGSDAGYLNEIYIRFTGNGGKARPVITSTTGCVVSGTAQVDDVVEVFGGTGPVNTRRNAKLYIGTARANKSGVWSLPVSNITYPFVTATATNSSNNTSELADNKDIAVDPLVASIIVPTGTLCAHQKLTFENPTKCKNGGDMVWDFGDGTPTSTSSSHTYASAGNYTVKLSLYDKNSCTGLPIGSTTAAITVTTCGEFDCATVPCPNGLTVSIGGPAPIYDGGSFPSYYSFTAIPSGGTQPYTYLWSNASSNLMPITNTTSPQVRTAYATTYPISIKVTITDKNGCSTFATYSYDPN